MLMKSSTTFFEQEPQRVRPAVLAGLAFVLTTLLIAAALLAFPSTAVHAGAASPVNLIGALEGLPSVQH